MFGWQLRQGLHAGAAEFDPRSLFRNGEQGVIYDPNDLSTLFQAATGTIQVTGVDQPVGLMLDKRLGLVRGQELVPDGGFDAGVAAFPFVARGTVTHGLSSAVLTTTSIAGTSGVVVALPGAPVFPVTGRYEVRITVSSRSVANASHRLLVAVSTGQNSGLSATERFYAPGVGEYTGILNAETRNTLTIASVDGAATIGDTFTLSSISIRELPGNHAFQTNAASRPMLRDTPRRIDYDAVDDALNVTFPAALGSACTVARSIPGVGAQILTAQTIGTSFTDNVDNCGIVIVNRALTAAELANLTRYLNQRAGI